MKYNTGVTRGSTRSTCTPSDPTSQDEELCTLCGKTLRYAASTSFFKDWGEKEKEFLKTHLGKTPPSNSFICRKHLLEAKRHHNDSTPYNPKWKGTQSMSKRQCISAHQDEKTIKPSFAPIQWLEAALHIECTEPKLLALCLHCYNELYRQFNSPSPCASCGGIPKQGTVLCRHSPDAIAVTKHLQRTTGSTITIQATDYLCNNCYKSHLAIITELQRERVEAEKTLENCITRLRVQEEHADTLTYKSVVQSALFVAEHLVQDKAVLLPHVCRYFLTCYGVKSQNLTLTLEENDCTVKFSSRWLLGQLIIHLNPHMQYICVHKKFGTMLYRTEGDILTCLSWALGSSSNVTEVDAQPEKTYKNEPLSKERVLFEAGEILNDIIHKEIKSLTVYMWRWEPKQQR